MQSIGFSYLHTRIMDSPLWICKCKRLNNLWRMKCDLCNEGRKKEYFDGLWVYIMLNSPDGSRKIIAQEPLDLDYLNRLTLFEQGVTLGSYMLDNPAYKGWFDEKHLLPE